MSIQQIRQASRGMWADAHTPGGLARNEIMAEVIVAEILSLIEKDPIGAAKSWVGDLMLEKYAWMMKTADVEMKWGTRHAEFARKNNTYPFRFELVDIMGPNVAEIIAQLVAEEYFMGGEDLTPYTLEAFFVNTLRQERQDPFMTYERPDVTIELSGETCNMGGQIVTAPPAGFREI